MHVSLFVYMQMTCWYLGLILKLLSPLKECYPTILYEGSGVADVILGIKITRTPDGINLSISLRG